MRRTRGRRHDAEDEVLRLLREHAAELLRFARRFSLCADDAQDAYQRSLEILLRRMRTDPPESPLSWLRTVLRHEALAVREQRLQDVDREELDLERHEHRGLDDPADRAEQFEQLAHAAEALQRLKPQEVTALVLRAEGLSYREICDRQGWTYTRCNRALTEGRRAFAARVKAIESGAECERWLPLLSLLADGEATARDLAELRPHLRGCRPCRATLRAFHAAPRQVGELVPAGLLPLSVAAGGASSGHGFGIGRQLEALAQTLSERATAGAIRMHGALEALPAAKMAAVAASTVAVAGGGAAIDQVARGGTPALRQQQSAHIAPPASPPASGTAFAPAAVTTTSITGPSPDAVAPPPTRREPQTTAATGPTPTAEFSFESAPAAPRDGRSTSRPAASTASKPEPPPPAPHAPAEFHQSPPPAAAAASPPPPPPPPTPEAPPEFAGP